MSSATSGPRSSRLPGALLAGLVTVGALSGCGGGSASVEAGSSSAASSSAVGASAPDLAGGLLPAEAFGPEAAVTALTAEQLRQGAGLAGAEDGLQITPEACADAVQGTQPQVDDFDDAAAQNATVGAVTTVEVLLRGGPTDDAVSRLDDAARTCPEAQLSSPDLGSATVTFESVPVTDLGDGAAALLFTTTLSRPDGSQVAVPALVGVVQDGDRLITLLTLSQHGSAPDRDGFTALLEQAYEVQAAALD